MKPLAVLAAALPLGACATVGEGADARPLGMTESQVLAYVIEKWEDHYARRINYRAELRGKEYQLLGIELVTCSDAYFGMGCTFEAIVQTTDQQQIRARFGGEYGMYDGEVTELIIVG